MRNFIYFAFVNNIRKNNLKSTASFSSRIFRILTRILSLTSSAFLLLYNPFSGLFQWFSARLSSHFSLPNIRNTIVFRSLISY